MKTRWLVYGIALFAMVASAQEFPREQVFSPIEQQIWQLSQQRPANSNPLPALQALEVNGAGAQAFWWAQRCRFAVQSHDKAELARAKQALKQLETDGGSNEFAGSAAGYKCQQLSKLSAGVSLEFRQLSFLAFHSLTARDTAALYAWVSLDYARDAVATGFYDSALQAVELVISIARRNQLQQLEIESLALMAKVQQVSGQLPEAAGTIRQALLLQTDPQQRRLLQLIQAEVMLATGRIQEAQTIYQTLWQEQSLQAGLALLAIRIAQQNIAAAQQLSLPLQKAAVQSGDRELIAISRLRHAMLLLQQGEVTTAIALFEQAGIWLSQHRLALYLPELQSWAALLSTAGQHQHAFSALQHSLGLQRQFDADQHQLQARLSSSLLIAEQRSREAKLLELQQQLNVSRAEAEASASQSWRLTLSLAVAAIFLLGLWWLRVRR